MNNEQRNSTERIRQAIRNMKQLAGKELKQSSKLRKHDMENAYGVLAHHAAKLHLQLPKLSTGYDPSQYLRHAQIAWQQLVFLEAIVASGDELMDPVYQAQSENGSTIAYLQFQLFYGATTPDVDWIIAVLRRYCPKVPIQNDTIEWALHKRRELDLEDKEIRELLNTHDKPTPVPAWRPHSWWEKPSARRRRQVIAFHFVEWMHAMYPLYGDAGEHALEAQLKAVIKQTLDTLSPRFRGGQEQDGDLLSLTHGFGAFVSLIPLSDRDSSAALDTVWDRLCGLGYPMEDLLAGVALYYERLAEGQPPIRDDNFLLAEILDSPGGARGIDLVSAEDREDGNFR